MYDIRSTLRKTHTGFGGLRARDIARARAKIQQAPQSVRHEPRSPQSVREEHGIR